MGLLDAMLGNAKEVSPADMQDEVSEILIPGEQIQKAYQIFRDSFVFTSKRLVLIDRQGMTGKKVEYHSIPYKSITQFSVETAGRFDLDAELKIWVSSQPEPIKKTFKKNLSVYEVERVLAHFVLGN